MKKTMIGLTLGLSVILAGCTQTDVIGKYAVTSFDGILKASGPNILLDEVNNGWSLKSPGGERFVWGIDFSTVDVPDLMIEMDGAPFIEAGLDPLKLDQDMYRFDSATQILMIRSELGSDQFSYSGEAQPLDAFKQLVKTHRDQIGYHEVLDHYGVRLGNGNMFEWAKDISKNDKDLVFVLNPQPLIEAGVKPENVKGWVFTQVEIVNDQGAKELVDKFLKPYDFK